MPIWNASFKLKDLIEKYGEEKEAGGYESELVPKYGKLIAARLEEQKGGLFLHVRALAPFFLKVKTESESNAIIDKLYDVCDTMRIWVD